MLDFRKMHGAGNDFAIIDARVAMPDLSAAAIAALADRRRGIGFDQLIRIEPSPSPAADVFMRIHNADGSVAGACGNATRCVAAVLGEATGRSRFVIATEAGLLPAEILARGRVRVDMGAPRLAWDEIPLAGPADTLHLPLDGDPAAASMGNPHATWFVDELAGVPVATLGLAREHDPLFPDRANIGFAQILAPDRIRLRVWERGAGLTLACGSGACAALVNAHRRGLVGRQATLELDGGDLEIEWRQADGHVLMTGPAVTAFRGTVEISIEPA